MSTKMPGAGRERKRKRNERKTNKENRACMESL